MYIDLSAIVISLAVPIVGANLLTIVTHTKDFQFSLIVPVTHKKIYKNRMDQFWRIFLLWLINFFPLLKQLLKNVLDIKYQPYKFK